MYSYKYTIPLKNKGIIKGFCSLLGKTNETVIKLGMKNNEISNQQGVKFVIVDPINYDVEIMDFKEEILLNKNIPRHIVCCICQIQTGGIELLMTGSSANRSFNYNKLVGILNMKLYDESISNQDETQKEERRELYDYLRNFDKKEDEKNDDDLDCIKIFSVNSVDIQKEIESCKKAKCEFVNPFKSRWEGAWWKVRYEGNEWHYIVGKVIIDKESINAIGIPGVRYKKPPCLDKFDLFVVSDSGQGYWLMLQRE